MSYANLVSFTARDITTINEVHTGDTSRVFLINDGFPMTRGSKLPSHGIGNNNNPMGTNPSSNLSTGFFSGGATAVAAKKQVGTFLFYKNSLLAGTTFTVGGKVYTAVTGAPGANDFVLGTDDTPAQLNVSADNLRQKINADTVTTLATSVDEDHLLIVTANVAGTGFAFSTNADPWACGYRIDTPNAAAIAGAKASITFSFAAASFVEGTQSLITFKELQWPLGSERYVAFTLNRITQAGDTINKVANDFREMLICACQGVPMPNSAYQLVSVDGAGFDAAILATTLQDIFGTTVAEVEANVSVIGAGNSTTLKLTARENGSGYNNIAMSTEVTNSIVLPIPVITQEGLLNLPSCYDVGGEVGFKITITEATQDINTDQSDVPLGTIPTGATAQGEFMLVQNTNQFLQEVVEGKSRRVRQNGLSAIYPGGRAKLANWGIVCVARSKISDTVFNVTVVWRANFVGGLPITRGRSEASSMTAQFRPQSIGSSKGAPYVGEYQIDILAA